MSNNLIIYDTGASVSIFKDTYSYELRSLPTKNIMTGNGRVSTSSGYVHPIFGLVYVLESLPVNIVSVYEINHNERFEVLPYPDGTMVVRVNDDVGTTFYVKWKNRTLVIDINDITTRGTFESMHSTQIEYEDLELSMIEIEEEVEV